MSITDTPRALFAGSQSTSVFTTLISGILSWNDRRVTRAALSSLTARELEDIGLTFSDIDRL